MRSLKSHEELTIKEKIEALQKTLVDKELSKEGICWCLSIHSFNKGWLSIEIIEKQFPEMLQFKPDPAYSSYWWPLKPEFLENRKEVIRKTIAIYETINSQQESLHILPRRG